MTIMAGYDAVIAREMAELHAKNQVVLDQVTDKPIEAVAAPATAYRKIPPSPAFDVGPNA